MLGFSIHPSGAEPQDGTKCCLPQWSLSIVMLCLVCFGSCHTPWMKLQGGGPHGELPGASASWQCRARVAEPPATACLALLCALQAMFQSNTSHGMALGKHCVAWNEALWRAPMLPGDTGGTQGDVGSDMVGREEP